MSAAFKIDKLLAKTISEARLDLQAALSTIEDLGNELEELIEAARETIDERSDAWREGDRCADVEQWLSEIEDVQCACADLASEGGSLVEQLEDVPSAPEYSS